MSTDGVWPAGQSVASAVGRTITDADNVWASCVTMNASPVHLDAVYMAATPAGRPLVLGVLTAAITLGLAAPPPSSGARLTGFERIRLTAPVFVGDTLRARATYDTPSRGEGDQRSAVLHVDGVNQDRVVVVIIDARYGLPSEPGPVDRR